MTVAIDGPAGAGKSCVARAVARALGVPYLDTGAMYRAVAVYMLDRGVDAADRESVAAACQEAVVDVIYAGEEQRVLLCGVDVTERLRAPGMDALASRISAVPEVRARLVEAQRAIARERGVVMDGRDIGTKVLPDADLKVYLTATPEERAQRRVIQMGERGQERDYESVLAEIKARDLADSTRAASPLRKAEDARELDSTDMPLHEVIARVLAWAGEAGK